MSQTSYQLLYPAILWAVFRDLLRSANERKCKNGQTKWPMASRWLFIPPVCNHLGEHHFGYPVLTRMTDVTGTEGRIRTFDLLRMRQALLPTELLRHIIASFLNHILTLGKLTSLNANLIRAWVSSCGLHQLRDIILIKMLGTPKGIRTPDSAVKGRRLRPLVDGSIYKTHKSKATFNPKLNAYCIHHNNE